MYQKKEKNILQNMSPHLSQLNVAMAHTVGIILGKIICESSNWQHIQLLQITNLHVGANWQHFTLERIIHKTSSFTDL